MFIYRSIASNKNIILVRRQNGFTYLGVLIFLAIIAITSATTLKVGKIVHRRAAEEALLDVGAEFSDALDSYRRMTPVGQSETPMSLQDLLKDPRFAVTVRHLRKLYADPIAGNDQWGLIQIPDTPGISGVHSLSNAHPIKTGRFETRFQSFVGKTAYVEWEFLPGQSDIVAASASNGNGNKGTGLISPLDLMDDEPAAEPRKSTGSVVETPATSNGLISPLDLR